MTSMLPSLLTNCWCCCCCRWCSWITTNYCHWQRLSRCCRPKWIPHSLLLMIEWVIVVHPPFSCSRIWNLYCFVKPACGLFSFFVFISGIVYVIVINIYTKNMYIFLPFNLIVFVMVNQSIRCYSLYYIWSGRCLSCCYCCWCSYCHLLGAGCS